MLAARLSFLLAVTVVPCLSGCFVSVHSYKQVDVSVIDAETGAPVSGAEISVKYPRGIYAIFLLPDDISATTDEEGKTSLDVAYGRMIGTGSDQMSGNWYIRAPHYLRVEGLTRLDQWIPGEFQVAGDHDTDHLRAIVEMYQAPWPTVTCVVPDDFRGLLKIEFQPIPKDAEGVVGERDFLVEASPDGSVVIDAPPLLLRAPLRNRHVQYASGETIPYFSDVWYPDSDTRVLVRRGGSAPYKTIYVIGTQSDAEQFHGLVYTKDKTSGADWLDSEAFEAFFAGEREFPPR